MISRIEKHSPSILLPAHDPSIFLSDEEPLFGVVQIPSGIFVITQTHLYKADEVNKVLVEVANLRMPFMEAGVAENYAEE